MISDAHLPKGLAPESRDLYQSPRGLAYSSARWTAPAVARVADSLATRGRIALEGLGKGRVFDAWQAAISALQDPGGELRNSLSQPLSRLCGLSEKGLAAALDTLAEGATGDAARRMVEAARPADDASPVALVLAGNLPGLALQSLLPPLLVGRPVLVKTSSAEPLFTPAFVAELARHEPALAEAIAVMTWPGGREEIEEAAFARAGRIVIYGDGPALADLERRFGDRVVGLGPGIGLAVVSSDVEASQIADALARDVALFDQRGCLSIHAIFTEARPRELADTMADSLLRWEKLLPPGPLDPIDVTAVQQMRSEAELRGLYRPQTALTAGTVVVETDPQLRASPGCRSLRIIPLPDLSSLPSRLHSWRGRLQGIALAGTSAWQLEADLRELGCYRMTRPGDLQRTDFDWWNGGRPPLEVFAGQV